MATSDMVRLLVSLVIATFMCRRGLRKQSLSRSGAGAAFVMGVCHMSCGWTFGLVLICFFLTSTKVRNCGSLPLYLENASAAIYWVTGTTLPP